MNKISDITAVGIDVSKAKLDIALLSGKGEFTHFIVTNADTDKGIKELLNRLSGYRGKVILESTGRYHLLCTLLLSEAGLDVRVLNPLLSHKYLQGGIRQDKTDRIDAMKLAQMAFMDHDLPPRFNQDRLSVVIRQKIGFIASLEKQMQTLKAIEKGYCESRQKLGMESGGAEDQISEAIKALDKARLKLEREIEALICLPEESSGHHQRLTSIPGVSPYGASLMIQFFDINSPQLSHSPKQWITYAGLDITTRQSGSWRGKGKLSKRGNAYLRKRIYAMAWGSIMHNDRFRFMYDKLKESGVCHVEALLRIARKIIRIAFALLKNGGMFDEKKIVFS